MNKKSEVRRRIKKVMAERGIDSQPALAKLLGSKPTTVNAWLTGASLPSPDGYMALGRMALSIEDSLFFWEMAGLSRDLIASAAAKIVEERTGLAGETVPIPRFRLAEHGREEAGLPVPLPMEFIPKPLATICFMVDENSKEVEESPRGLVILDVSYEGAEDLSSLWGHVVALVYAPEYPRSGLVDRTGIYVGRLADRYYRPREPEKLRMHASLIRLTDESPPTIPLGIYVETTENQDIDRDDSTEEGASSIDSLQRARSGFRLLKGIRILGRVIGRLSGHLER